MRNMDEVYDALRRADADGRTEDVARLSQYINEQDSVQEEPVEAATGFTEFDPMDGMNTLDKTVVGVGRGMTNIGRGIQDAYFRVTDDDDALSSLNKRIEGEEAGWKHLADTSTAATIGEIGGEIAATLPLGMGVIGGAGKLGMGAAKTVMAEGAIVEGLTQRGDLGDRAVSAGIGAATGFGMQKGMDFLSGAFKKFRVGRDSDKLLATMGKQLTDADTLIKKARKDGGFELDYADALGDNKALRTKQDLTRMDDEGFGIREFTAQQDRDIMAKANSFMNGDAGNHMDNVELGEELQELVVGIRNGDKAAYKAFYSELDEAAGGPKLDTEGLANKLPVLLSDHKPSVDSVASQVQGVLKKYGVFQQFKAAGDEFGEGGFGKGIDTGRVLKAPEKALRISNYDEMVAELNDLYKPMASKGENRVIGETKEVLEGWIDDAVEGLGADPSIIELGRSARKARANFAKRWEAGDALEKLTSKGPGNADYKMLPTQAVEHFTKRRNVADLQRLKDTMNLGTAEQKAVWDNMQSAHLFKAFQAATKNVTDVAEAGQQQFDANAFHRVWNSMPPKSRDILYGAKKAKEVDSAIASWRQRGKRARLNSSDNPSGTARASVGVLARLTLPAGRSAGAALAALPILKDVIGKAKGNAIKHYGDDLIAGKLPNRVVKDRAATATAALREHYKGLDILNYDRGIATVARLLTYTDDDE